MSELARLHTLGRDFNTGGFPHDVWREMASAGLFRVALPGDFGGDGGTWSDIAACETSLVEISGSPGLAMSWAGGQMVARWFIAGFADHRQKAAYLPAIAEGRMIASVAVSEPGAGAHPKHLQTNAALRGDTFVLNGEKAYVTNGPLAGLYVVFAITALAEGRKRYSAFLVPRGTPGLELVAQPELDFLRPSPHCRLKLTDCAVQATAMLGPADTAYERMVGPFRDVEDAVGTGGLVGALRHALRRLADATSTPDDAAAAALGELAAMTAIIARASESVVGALDQGCLDQDPIPAELVGIRTLGAAALRAVEAFRQGFGTAHRDGLAPLLRDLGKSFEIAKGPRLVKQSRLGFALLRKQL
ncbi:MAG TPA: acyl-CoA dehydrogenase family protein [Candidatus Cybelea sp.]|nr:acyl-CoA dehydrogenase family protein [Candidatus Cybelea sp.]